MTAPVKGAGSPSAVAGRPPGAEAEEGRRWATVGAIAVGLVVAAGIALRLYSRSDLWLDEALSVNIARLSPGDLLDALARDGHPPFYYLLLHGWIQLFGDGDVAVRSLSAVFGLLALPLAYVVARRTGGERAGLGALLVLALSPFAIRYATETRMYSLVMVLVLAGWLALRACLERPTVLRVVSLALAGGLLALTHYWSFYLLAATALVLLLGWRRGTPNAATALLGVCASAIVFLPWLPTFLDQAGSTGTPWGRPERPTVVLMVSLTDWGGGPYAEAQLLGFLLLAAIALALLALPIGRHLVELDVRTRPGIRPEAGIAVLTVLLAVVAGYATDSAFAPRYTAVIFPVTVVVVGYGLSRLPSRAWVVSLAVILALSTVGGLRSFGTQRTQAGQIASYIVDQGAPGDVVAFCPDQLGPAVSRLLPDDQTLLTFPSGGDPAFVDWADYAEKQAAGDPAAFARELVDRAGPGTIWLVWAGAYRTLGTKCEELVNELGRLRPSVGVIQGGTQFEHAELSQFGPAG